MTILRVVISGAVHLHRPGRGDCCIAHDAVHPQPGIALHGVVGLDCPDDALHALHDIGEIELGISALQAEFLCPGHVRKHFRRTQQRFAGNAAGVEAVSAHPVPFDQGDPGLDGGRDQGADQAGGTGAEHDEVRIETLRLPEAAQGFARLQLGKHFLAISGKRPSNANEAISPGVRMPLRLKVSICPNSAPAFT